MSAKPTRPLDTPIVGDAGSVALAEPPRGPIVLPDAVGGESPPVPPIASGALPVAPVQRPKVDDGADRTNIRPAMSASASSTGPQFSVTEVIIVNIYTLQKRRLCVPKNTERLTVEMKHENQPELNMLGDGDMIEEVLVTMLVDGKRVTTMEWGIELPYRTEAQRDACLRAFRTHRPTLPGNIGDGAIRPPAEQAGVAQIRPGEMVGTSVVEA